MSEKTNPFLKPGKGKQFLVNFLSRFGAKPGKMSVAGINLPEFNVSEKVIPTLFPNRDEYNKAVIEKNEELNKEGSIYGSNFPIVEKIASVISGAPQNIAKDIEEKKKEKENQKDLGDAAGDTKTTKMLLTETLLREFENRMQNRRDLNFIAQSMPIVDTYAETAMQRALQADRFSPTKISQQRLRAQTGEAALMQAIANQASAAAQIGSLGTGRRYGR